MTDRYVYACDDTHGLISHHVFDTVEKDDVDHYPDEETARDAAADLNKLWSERGTSS